MKTPAILLINLSLSVTIFAAEPSQITDFKITDFTVAPSGEATVSFPSDADHYYILHQDTNLSGPATLVDIALGAGGTMQLADENPGFPPRVFFRVERIAVAAPRDLDGDGIDDVYELQNPAILHPFDADDADDDPDGNGESHLEEYLEALSPGPGLLAELVDGEGGFDHLASANSVFVAGTTAYVAAPADDALTILDVSDPGNPQLLAEVIDGQSGFGCLDGANCVFVAGTTAYVTALFDHALTIIDVSDPENPQLLAEVVDGLGGFSQLGGANYVHVSGTNAYVTASTSLFQNGDDALTIIDVSDPANPQLLAELVDDSKTFPAPSDFTRLRGANSVFVSGTTAYVTAATAIESDEALTIIDVSDPSSPHLLAELGDDGSHHMEGPRSVFVSGTTAYVTGSIVGLTYLGGGSLTMIDVSDPANPQFLGEAVDESFEPGSGFPNLGQANSVFVTGTTAYVTAGADHALNVIDVSDPSNPQLAAEVIDGQGGFSRLEDASSVFVSSGIAYVTALEFDPATQSSESALTIIDVSGVVSP